jgi:choline dehydrogenase-like flavoprotein
MIYLPGSAGDWKALAARWEADPESLRLHLPHQIPKALWPCAEKPEIHLLSHLFLDACRGWRDPGISRFLAEEDYTFGPFPRTMRSGRRIDAYQAFVAVEAVAKRVSVRTNTQVSRIVFDRKRAVAVECHEQGKAITYAARKGILLCAGAIESPALLMRSGIGSAPHLQSLGISVINDLPGVGRNLQDHLLMPTIFESRIPSLTSVPTLEDSQRYRWHGKGPLASNLAEAGCFMDRNAAGIPQLQIHFTPTHYLEYSVRAEPTSAFSLGVTLLQPFSRGQITLASADPSQAPWIDPGYLTDSRDLERLTEGIAACRELAGRMPLACIKGRELLPGEKRSSKMALGRAIQAYAQTVYHPVGTCAVGTSGESVVNTDFRVHGTEGLYIVDASVIDRIPACNPAAQIMALASLAADRIAQSFA